MSTRNERHVTPHPDGWQVTKPGASRASAVVATQADAIGRAREITGNSGGGEVVIHRPDGTIRDSDTVAPGNDPFPPRDERLEPAMTTFDGALISEQGVRFGLLIVKPVRAERSGCPARIRVFATQVWGGIPIVLMGQDGRGVPTYQGRPDIVRFLANIDIRRIPFKRWTVTPNVA